MRGGAVIGVLAAFLSFRWVTGTLKHMLTVVIASYVTAGIKAAVLRHTAAVGAGGGSGMVGPGGAAATAAAAGGDAHEVSLSLPTDGDERARLTAGAGSGSTSVAPPVSPAYSRRPQRRGHYRRLRRRL